VRPRRIAARPPPLAHRLPLAYPVSASTLLLSHAIRSVICMSHTMSLRPGRASDPSNCCSRLLCRVAYVLHYCCCGAGRVSRSPKNRGRGPRERGRGRQKEKGKIWREWAVADVCIATTAVVAGPRSSSQSTVYIPSAAAPRRQETCYLTQLRASAHRRLLSLRRQKASGGAGGDGRHDWVLVSLQETRDPWSPFQSCSPAMLATFEART